MTGDTMEEDKGLLIVLSGPSGVGKGTVCKALQKREINISYSVSVTTRLPRQGEVDGVNYFFKSDAEFRHMVANDDLLEWAEYAGHFYGTPKSYVMEQIERGHDVLLEIEVQGARQVKQKYPQGIFIFLVPPSMVELKNRIVKRGTETEDIIQNRMTIAEEEVEMMEHYDYVVVNDHVEKACDRIEAIIIAEHCKKERKIKQYRRMLRKGE